MLKNYAGGWVDRGIHVSNGAPWITHLLFADDFQVFMKADSRSAMRLSNIPLDFYVGSGQSVNKEKAQYSLAPIVVNR